MTRAEKYVTDWLALLDLCRAGASEVGAEIRRLGSIYRKMAQDEQGEVAQTITDLFREPQE